MSIVTVVVDALLFFLRLIYLWCLAIVKAVLPAKLQGFKDVSGQVCLVTGAGSGLGRMMSQRFASLGCRMVLWDINADGNEETARLLKAAGASVVKTYKVDLSSRQDIYDVADKVKADVGDVDILVNNAGIVTGKKFLECSDGLIEKTMAVNTSAHFWTVKSFLPSMLTNNKGHIVSIASSAGFFGVSGLADYCASKFGAVGFNESLRNELSRMGKDGVRTTVVCPYYINTGMFEGVKSRIPILEPEFVVNKIMEAVLTNQEVLMVPKDIYLFYFLRGVLPINVSQLIGKVFGINSTMDDFVGRNKAQ